jgi:polysaccharide export outer membrane protein
VRDDRYRIGFQDDLTIRVFRHSDLDQKVSVSPAGTIMLFRLDKPLVAVCKTQEELASDIATAYKAKFIRDPQVTVNADQQSQSIMVIGSVEHAGNYFVKRRYQLLEMLALAGGPNKEAGNRMIVARTGSSSDCKDVAAITANDAPIELYDFKIRDVQEGKKTLWLQPGDVVSVLDADIIYVYGNVNKQGAIKIKGPTTLMQILASAEGLEPAAKKDKVRILRQIGGNAERTELVFDLNLIDKGKVKDPFLEPSDIVAVSQDSTKAILRSLTTTLKTTLPSVIYRVP